MNEQEKQILRWNSDALRFILDNMVTSNEGERHELLDDYERINIDSEIEKSGLTLPQKTHEVLATEGEITKKTEEAFKDPQWGGL